MKRKSESTKNKNKKTKVEVPDIQEVYADPTYDVTFKMLFASDDHKDLLISLLNSLLGFSGGEEITDVEIGNNELSVSGIDSVVGAVDVLCTTASKQKIAVEMQRKHVSYFLPRSQEYMSKIIFGQVTKGQGKEYDKAVLDTYILVIGKDGIFVGKDKLSNEKLFEVDVAPTVKQTGQVVPGNKMHWKFFELKKFKDSSSYKSINKDSPIKEQWLEFLIDCNKQKTEPDRNEVIKKGYDIMKTVKWTEDQKILYWKQKANEEDLRRTIDEEIKESFTKGEIKGEIKGEVSKVKDFFGLGISLDKIIPKLKFLTNPKVKDKLEENLAYIRDHAEDSDSDICEALGLVGSLSDTSATDI